MIAPPRPGRDEYASSLAGYVARIADGEDVNEVLVTRYGE